MQPFQPFHLESYPYTYPRRPSVLAQVAQRIRSWSGVALQLLVPSTEPQIRHVENSSGQRAWRVYDPLTERSTTLDSEQEVLVWLEERHYDRSRRTSDTLSLEMLRYQLLHRR